MKKVTLLASASVLATLMAAPVLAQDILSNRDLDYAIGDVERDVNRDMARSEDSMRFDGTVRQGLSGSAALGYSGKTGNNESQDFTLALRLRHGVGNFEQTIGAVLDYTETDNTSDKKDMFAIYDANYYFNDRFYGFVLGRIQVDGLADEATDPAGSVKRDGFLGFGPGYRIVNTTDMTWRVQAGVGISYLEFGDDRSVTEAAAIASSRFYYKINDNVFLTNDTDVINSDEALRANNDFGVNFKVTDTMSTRVSYLTEYNESRDIRTDNKLGVSLVFGF